MDKLTFISNITDSLVWPVIIIVALLVLKTPISKLIPKVKKVKFKDLEADFQGLSVSEQSLLFLDGVARKDQWTFYEKTRSGERALGQAFLIIVRDLLHVERDQIIQKLKQWLVSENENLMWFACEVIGYFRVSELKKELFEVLPNNSNIDLRNNQLNALWAYARITGFENLNKVLQSTTSKSNQKWLLFVYEQMPNESDFMIDYRINELRKFIDRNSIDKDVALLATEILSRLEALGNNNK